MCYQKTFKENEPLTFYDIALIYHYLTSKHAHVQPFSRIDRWAKSHPYFMLNHDANLVLKKDLIIKS